MRNAGAVDKYDIDIAVFFNADDIYQEFVFNSAEKMFRARNTTFSDALVNDIEVEFHFSKPNLTNVSANGLSSIIPKVTNITSNSQGIIFVDVTEDGLLYSTLLESCSIPSIGLLQSQTAFPITQESSGGFTRVAAPSIIEYAQAMIKIIQKMGWQTISLVVSATYEGHVFADAITDLAFDKKWRVLSTLWIQGHEHLDELSARLQNVTQAKPDVIIGHIRERHNDNIFRSIQNLKAIDNSSAWLVSDVTAYGVQDINSIPAGVIQVSGKSPEIGHDYELYINVLFDSFVMFESAFRSSVADLSGELRQGYSSAEKYKLLQREAVKRLKKTHFSGESLLFRDHFLSDHLHSVFIIWNLRRDLDGRKHWFQVGLATPSGLALEPIVDLNGHTLSPLLNPRRPLLRVPVVLWPPLVQAEDPSVAETRETCAGRALPCYKYASVKNSTRRTKQLLCCFGASIDFLKFLQRDLGFDTEIYLTPDGQYGKSDSVNGTWNGIVNELISGKADLALDLAESMDREKVIQTVYPCIASAMNILVEKQRNYGEQVSVWYSWLKPFENDLWIAILVTCNLVLVVVWWLDRKSPKGYYHILKDSDEDAFTLLDAMSYIWGVAFSKDIGAEKTPRSNSARIVSAFYALLALIMVNTYCANLMAFLLQEPYILPISGVRDAKLTSNPPDVFKLGVTSGSNEEAYFKNHVEDYFRKIYQVNLKIHLVNGLQDGMQQLMEKQIDGLVGDYLSLQQAANKVPNCSYSLAGPNFYTFGYGFAFPKGSPWAEEANLSVLKNQENGSIQAIMDYWFNKKECTTPVKELGAEKFIGLFLLLVGVIGFSIMALISEMLIIFALIKFGRRLGPLGKFMKRMIFSVRKGEENEIHIKWLQLYRHHKSMRPNEVEFAEARDTSIRRASFCNLSFEFGGEMHMLTRDEHTLYLRRCQLLDVDNVTIETAEVSEPNNVTPIRTDNVSL
ncbi:hypothetical protein ACROYT_G016377 [Oculina patagonica]